MCFLKNGNSNTKSLAYTSLVRAILEYRAAWWDPYRGQINTLDRVQKKAAKFANHTSDSVWEALAQRRKISRIFSLFKTYFGERAWKAIGDRLWGPCYLSRNNHDRKIRARKERSDIGKYVYSFVNRKIRLWNQLPAQALKTSFVDHIFWKRGLGN